MGDPGCLGRWQVLSSAPSASWAPAALAVLKYVGTLAHRDGVVP
jgi:hypothetical protein